MRRHKIEIPIAEMETPVLNPDVYLLRAGNQEFIEGLTDTPQLNEDHTIQLRGQLFFGVLLLQFLLGMVGLYTQSGIRIPALFIIGLCVFPFLALMIWRARTQDEPGGWIVPGTVLEAETIVVSGSGEFVRIRYRFSTPGGVIEEGYVATSNAEANHLIAPRPDTPVYVWYTDDDTCHLL